MIRRSIALSSLETYLGILIQLCSSVVLARLLTPGQIGVFATAAVFAAIASKIRDFGLSEYLIQMRAPSPEQIDAAFTTNLLVSWGTCLAMLALSVPIADFFGDPILGDVIRLQVLAYLVLPFGAIHLAWHHRNLNFRPIVVSGISANLAGAVTSVIAAWIGLGTLSLAWGAVVGSLVSVAVALGHRSEAFRPKWRFEALGSVMRYGVNLSKIFVLGQAGRNAPDLVIAKLVDFTGVAHFSRASGLVDLFNQSVMRVVNLVSLPVMAMADREGAGRLAAFERAQVFVTGIGWAFFLSLMFLAQPVVALLYGEQWEQAVPLVRVLCAVAAIELTYALARDLLLSTGLAAQASRMEGVVQLTRVVSLILIIPFGLLGACVGLVLASIINAVYVFRALTRTVGLDVRRCWHGWQSSASVAAVGALPAVAWSIFVARADVSGILLGAAAGVLGAGCWLVALRLLNHPLHAEIVGLYGRWRGGV